MNGILFEKKIDVNTNTALELLSVFQNDSAHTICHNLLGRNLFSEGIKVLIKNRHSAIAKPSDDVVDYLFNKYYLKLIRDAFPDFMALGYSACIKVVDHTDQRVKGKPVEYMQQLPRDKYILYEQTTTAHQRVWKARFVGSGLGTGDEPEIFVYMMPSHHPDSITGQHRSIVSPTVKHSIFISQLNESFVEAHMQRSHPPVLVQHVQQTTAHQANGTLLEKTDPVMMHADNVQSKIETYKIQSNLKNEDLVYDSITKENNTYITDIHGPETKRRKFLPTVLNSRYTLPDGLETAQPQPPMPEPQTDLLQYSDDRKNEIYAQYGIPPSCVLSGSRGGAHTNSSVIDDHDLLMFHRTLQDLSSFLCSYLEFAYLSLYPELEGQIDIEISLPMVPMISSHKIQELIDQDIITTKAGKRLIASIIGIDERDLVKEGQGNVHIRPPRNGNENQTTGLMEAKEYVMRQEGDKAKEEKLKIRAERLGGGEGSEGEQKLMDKELELKEMEIEGQLEIMDKQMELEKIKVDAAMKKATAAVKVAKAKPKTTSSSTS